MTIEELIESTQHDSQPPAELSEELKALWHTKANNWDTAHNIAQDIHTPTGSWIHALLHLIEGDIGNAGYWFRKAGKPARTEADIQTLWEEIAASLM